mmetsp:Transcript_20120/g.55674  ORF Transcript_20120/g.55674 Transcript_20120/m.55674 type:complete len:219 (-) Transcript_20120:963-1619(-)
MLSSAVWRTTSSTPSPRRSVICTSPKVCFSWSDTRNSWPKRWSTNNRARSSQSALPPTAPAALLDQHCAPSCSRQYNRDEAWLRPSSKSSLGFSASEPWAATLSPTSETPFRSSTSAPGGVRFAPNTCKARMPSGGACFNFSSGAMRWKGTATRFGSTMTCINTLPIASLSWSSSLSGSRDVAPEGDPNSMSISGGFAQKRFMPWSSGKCGSRCRKAM